MGGRLEKDSRPIDALDQARSVRSCPVTVQIWLKPAEGGSILGFVRRRDAQSIAQFQWDCESLDITSGRWMKKEIDRTD